MKIGPMTWLGFGVALIGWVLLVGALTISDTLLRAGDLVSVLSMRGEAVTLGQSLIVSGFGLAVVGTLRAGFGAFTRFFDAVLQRSAAPRPRAPTPLEPEPLVSEPLGDRDEATGPGQPAPYVTLADRDEAELRPVADRSPAHPSPPRPGRGKERNYVILSDGSVEVETMFGTRVFASLDEAKDFIR